MEGRKAVNRTLGRAADSVPFSFLWAHPVSSGSSLHSTMAVIKAGRGSEGVEGPGLVTLRVPCSPASCHDAPCFEAVMKATGF